MLLLDPDQARQIGERRVRHAGAYEEDFVAITTTCDTRP
jgi:hypothetical protein